LEKGIHFCMVKGVSHSNSDGSSRSEAMKLCSIGDTVKLEPEPWNEHDRNAIRVVLMTGQQIGYISARQAARFAGRVHLLTATVHSQVEDEWGNDTLKLKISERPAPAEQATGRGGCLAALILAVLVVFLLLLTTHGG
jgi:HIRAN domain